MERILDWEQIKTILRRLEAESPKTLEGVLIGGAACWAYLKLTTHKPFFTEEEEKTLLSKDLDFADVSLENLPREELNLPIGSLQLGARLCAEDYFDTARIHSIPYSDGHLISVAIADPLDLYREKDAMCARWNRPQDPLHKRILQTYIQQEILHGINGTESQTYSDQEIKILRTRCKSYAPEILRDLQDRLNKLFNETAPLLAQALNQKLQPEHPLDLFFTPEIGLTNAALERLDPSSPHDQKLLDANNRFLQLNKLKEKLANDPGGTPKKKTE